MGRAEHWEDELDELEESKAQGADERWLRRAARREAERQRLPKHGRGYVELTQQMIARRGALAGSALERVRKDAARRKGER